MSNLTTTFIDYFSHVRAHHAGVDMVFAGGMGDPYAEDVKAHADKNGWTFVICQCCAGPLGAHTFEAGLMNTHKTSVSLPALEAATAAAGVHVVTPPSWIPDGGSYGQHSIVFHPGPEGWIDELYKHIAIGKLIGAAPNANEHGVYRTTTVTYPGIYAKAVNELFQKALSCTSPRQYIEDCKEGLEDNKRDAEWLLDYRRHAQEDVFLTFNYEHLGDFPVECKKCMVIMYHDTIAYQCRCPVPTFESIDKALEDTIKPWVY